MTTFDRIAEDLLTSMGYEIDYSVSEEEAIRKASKWTEGQPYPVYFSVSDTSGEKVFEEFYIEGEAIDMKRFLSLGVITDKLIPDKDDLVDLIHTLDRAFESENCTKADIVKILVQYLSNFEHIETGRCLDWKM